LHVSPSKICSLHADAIARCDAARGNQHIFRFARPPWAPPRPPSIHGLSASPDGGSLPKNTTSSKPGISAIWPRKGRKVLQSTTGRVCHYLNSVPRRRPRPPGRCIGGYSPAGRASPLLPVEDRNRMTDLTICGIDICACICISLVGNY
jgi:hypothetical protein